MEGRGEELDKTLYLRAVVFVVGMFIFVGLVGALNLGLSEFKDTHYTVGERISFLASMDINSSEGVSIQDITLEVNQEAVCVFSVYGEELKDCEGIDIAVVPNSANFINGGEVYGHFVYNISIDTPQSYVNVPSYNHFRLIAQTLTHTISSRFNSVLIGDSTGSNFSMGTYDSEAIFSGVFDNSTLTFIGQVRWIGDPSIIRVGAGDYLPASPTSGSLFVHFINPNNEMDPGMGWTGIYNATDWTIVSVQNSSDSLSGRVFVPFG